MRLSIVTSLVFAAQISAQSHPTTQAELFGLEQIWDVAIEVDRKVWLAMLPKRRPPGTERTDYPYGKGRIRIGEHAFLEVGIRFKGNSTFWMTGGSLKRSFKIDFDRVKKGQSFLGLKKLNLNNNALDGTQIREAVCYAAYRDAGVPAARTGFARVSLTIPGTLEKVYLGFYTLVEQVDGGFLRRNFQQAGALFKPTWTVLSHHGPEWNEDYERDYVPKTKIAKLASGDELLQRIVDLAKLNSDYADGWSTAVALTEEQERAEQAKFGTRLEQLMDVEAFLRYTAVTTLVGNQDSPFVFPHNYYLFVPERSKKVLWLPWDLNNSLGGLGILGSGQLHRQSIMQPTLRPVFVRVLGVPRFRARYREIVTELVKGPCSAARMIERIDRAAKVAAAPKAAERGQPEIVRKAGELGGHSQRSRRVGLGGSGRVSALRRFVRKREASVLDQLAGRSEGLAARPNALDTLLKQRRGRGR